ncbi:DUF4411 family protein [Glaciimonas immobilis]|uniref:Putative nucleic acid-binding protein n=1 Tax=Glaciimonas immobilis TaxID=728004 RepID=A0A840RTG5_9BURK|nr:DUF4411 family protein [Glaciimonas immobilis]KAF3997004.1 DUF4411 family protein [Glaciimonas immobilis]MBB5199840.1 putative nucleic acid-binding protein [Glaciimonas immobilis]
MLVFDASSIIYAWDNYPVEQFPGLWDWIGDQIDRNLIQIPSVAYTEIAHPSPDCAAWLETRSLIRIAMTNNILLDALRIKILLHIVDDKYGAGVGENDLFIIATARAHRAILVSDERMQPDLPKLMPNYKIPAVCKMEGVNVECINFLEFIKRSGAVF